MKKFLVLTIILFSVMKSSCILFTAEDETKILNDLLKLLERGAKEVKTFSSSISTTFYYSKKGEELKLDFYSKAPDKWRIDLTSPQKIAGGIISSDGEMLYQFTPALKRVGKIKIKGSAGANLMKTYVGFLADYALKKGGESFFKGLDIKYAGKDKIKDQDVYGLKILPKEEDEFTTEQTIYFNSKTGVPVKLIITYKTGLIRKMEIIIENVKINEDISDNIFKLPDNYKGK